MGRMRYLCLVMAAVFVLFTYWQFNDLEQYHTKLWYGWVVVYALCAVVSLVSWSGALPRWIYICGALMAVVVAGFRVLSVDWDRGVLFNDENPAGNEAFGLLLVAIWLAVLAWRHADLGCKCKER